MGDGNPQGEFSRAKVRDFPFGLKESFKGLHFLTG